VAGLVIFLTMIIILTCRLSNQFHVHCLGVPALYE